MNITYKYNLSMGSANLTKLENAKKQYGNAKFSIDETTTENVNKAISKYDKDFEKKRLRQVSEDFEALMINQMLKEMRKTVNKTGLIDGGMAEQIFEDMLYDEYAKEFSKTKTFGLADIIYNQMEKYV
ncbi:rod-binding protein [Brachyspira hyodysenteriae]|uniref:rod-binding protein n=1 Tax=Brachyspira hyodysenteriae TaxID=159 RepID=UPI00063DA996|nr:rod-binding protein [Brachyspira hyodysenteriae]KLI13507.1 flagellar rod assembly protein FlgJ [Brachyspira hyodysenteriae]KLI59437.1 flagellar rod assembly protein FlgJ [Brachyspira hyodysenteriae]